MEGKTLTKYLASADDTNAVVEDVYFNDVILLISGSKDDNSRGLPFSRDYSRYQRHVKNITGSNVDSTITYPTITTPTLVDAVTSYLNIPNASNRILRAAEVNLGQLVSSVIPTYADAQLSGWSDGFSLGSDNFTIEISFFFNNTYELQTIFTVGSCVVWDSFTKPVLSGGTSGYGIFLENNDLVFFAAGTRYKINVTSLSANTFYSVCVQRTGSNIQTYLNFVQTNQYNFSGNLDYSVTNNEDTKEYRLYLGASPYVQNAIQTSFSGDLSNFRITKSIARYPNSFYGSALPFYKGNVDNKIDTSYSDVVFNFPLQFDAYDYSPNKLRLANTQLRNTTPNFNTGFVELDGDTIYSSEIASTNISTSEWTAEFYLGLYANHLPLTTEKTLQQWLSGNPANTEDIEQVNLLKITSNGKLVLSVDFNYFSDGNENFFSARSVNFLSFSLSENGTTYKDFDSEINNQINAAALNSRPAKTIPSNRAVFYYNGGMTANLGVSSTLIKPQNSEPNTHFAVTRSSNFLYFYVNGINVKSIAYSGTLYQETNNLVLSFGSLYSPWLSYAENKVVTLGVKGLRVTNSSRYLSTTNPNDYFYVHSLHPLPLNSGVLAPPKARVIVIKVVNTNPSISSGTCQWYVYFSQAIDGLILADFTLTQIEGVSGATLVSVQKNNELEYLITANTGLGSGKLSLNFLDRKTVKYKGLNTFISNYVGELSYFGDVYKINKNSPAPTISSGSSPYINETFTCTVVWDSAIVSFDFTKIGVSNGVISNIILVDDISQTYQFNVTPEKQGVVYVQIIEAAAITDGGILSSKSNLLARIYAEAFPILQLPLDLSSTFYDVSPNAYQLNEIIANNTLFSTTTFPLGESSALSVVPQLEQSGLEYLNFEAIGQGSSLILNGDWTIEFNLLCNTYSPQNTAHILSVEKAGTGFAILAINGNIQVCRSIDIPTSLFSVYIPESDIFSGGSPIYPAFANNSYTQQQKFPHFAITKKGNVYRFYRNGIRIGLVASSETLNISSGDLKVGYYRNRVTQAPYFLSNVRLTVGKALYTAYQHDIPLIPYPLVTNILDITELLDYISITSNNAVANKAVNGNTIRLEFNSIVNLTNLPIVTILGQTADVVNTIYNTYVATLLVDETIDQKIYFNISIQNEPSLPNKEFTTTTNNTSVFIENSPFTIVLATTQPNDNSYKLYATATLNKDASTFSLAALTLTNCIVGGLIKASNNNAYNFEVQALTSGDFSLKVEAGAVASSIGTLNKASNTLTRTAVVPAYLPDPYYPNTLLLLQPTGTNIVDESQYEVTLAVNNVDVVADEYPTGLLKSMRFNGQGSSIVATLPTPMSANQDYCIEFYIYLSSLTTFSLSAPIASPASSVTPTSFDISWSDVVGATDYVVDISNTNDFSRKIDGFDNKLVGDVNSVSVTTDSALESPVVAPNRVKAEKGFVAEWQKRAGAIGYRVYSSLSSTFNTSIQAVSGLFTRSNNVAIGNVVDAIEYTPEPIVGNVTSSSGSYSSNSILQGILSSGATSPKIFAFNDEATLRCYKANPAYTQPAIAEDIEVKQWFHVALTNSAATKSTKLFINGALQDKLKNSNMSWDAELNIGAAITNFSGYITGFRITLGQARYTTDFEVPQLPLPKN